MKTTKLFTGLILLSSLSPSFAQQNPGDQSYQNSKSVSAPPTWSVIAGSRSIKSSTGVGSKPLQYNASVNAITFVHQSSATYSGNPINNDGVIVTEISSDNGSSWDSTCVWSSATFGNYPQGALFSSPGNTNVANAFMVVSGQGNNGSGNITGNIYGSKQVGSGTYNSTASSIPNSLQFFPNTGSFPFGGKHDNAYHSFTSTSDGKMRTLGIICNDVNSTNESVFGLRGAVVAKGSFNAGAFTWTTDSLIPNTILRTDGSKQLYKEPIMAWSNDGMTGYVILIGVKASATGSNKGWQPIIYKTSNSGNSWTLMPGIDFNSYAFINSHLDPVNGSSSLIIPQFSPEEGIDATVDAGGNLHLVTTIRSTLSQHNDSLHIYRKYSNLSDMYQWKHVPGKRPYIYDFIGNGTGFWQYALIDSISSEAPGVLPAANGYTANPWDADPLDNSKPAYGSRLQLSKSADEKYIVFTWAESDSVFTNSQTKWNSIPNLKARLLNCNGGYFLNTNKSIITTNSNTNIFSRAYFHNISPNFIAYGLGPLSTYTVSLPITITNNISTFSLTNVSHWYTKDAITFNNVMQVNAITESFPTTLKEIKNETGAITAFPNPFDSKLVIEKGKNSFKLSDVLELKLFGIDGKEVLSEDRSFTSQTIELNTETIKPGVYFLQISLNGQITEVKKIVK